MPTVPAAFGPMIDEYMRSTGQMADVIVRIPSSEPKELSIGIAEAKKKLVDPLCLWLKDALTLVLPVVTVAEANGRDWKARSRRSGSAWKAVRQVARIGEFARFEARIRAGKAVSAHFVRLGGRELDRMVNLPSALKGVEDAVAYLIGVDDRSPLWVPSCAQEPGPRWGVRVELRIPPAEGPRPSSASASKGP